jgi:DNA-binding LytR/AlgR family response regulator
MKVVIVEDEALAASKLERQLKAIDENIEVVFVLESVVDAIEWFQKNKCDLILLDIHLSDGLSFKIFEKIKINTPIIFTTAYDQYAIQAFKVNALDYLLKPISKGDLSHAISQYKTLLEEVSSENIPAVDFAALTETVEAETKDFKERFMIKGGGGKIKVIAMNEVAYFFAEGKYAFLVDKKGEEHLIDLTLEKLVNALNPKEFFRINRQFILSINSIDKMVAWTKSRVKIDLNPPSKKDAIVSVERSSDFKKWLDM